MSSLTNKYGETIDQRQPLPVVGVQSSQISQITNEVVTPKGKSAAGAVVLIQTVFRPIRGSHWEEQDNLIYSAFSDSQKRNADVSWLTAFVETNGSAAFTIHDPDLNLENLFESRTGTVKSFVAKVTDKEGKSLYGWIFGVAVSGSVYTFDVVNNRLTETRNWVGDISEFDAANVVKVEIFEYKSTLVFAGGALLEEVRCPREFSKDRQLQLVHAAKILNNGQYIVDRTRGEIIGKLATADAITVSYEINSGGDSLAPAYENNNLERAMVVEAYDSDSITTATTTAVKATDGVLGGVSVLATLTGTVTINDGGGTKVVLPIGLPVGFHKLPFVMTGEIEVVTSAADNIVVYFL